MGDGYARASALTVGSFGVCARDDSTPAYVSDGAAGEGFTRELDCVGVAGLRTAVPGIGVRFCRAVLGS